MECESKAVVSTSTNINMSAIGREVEVDYGAGTLSSAGAVGDRARLPMIG